MFFIKITKTSKISQTSETVILFKSSSVRFERSAVLEEEDLKVLKVLRKLQNQSNLHSDSEGNENPSQQENIFLNVLANSH